MSKYTCAFALIVALTGSACEIAAAGEENVVSFRLDAAINAVPVDFTTPIAVGMSVDVLTQTIDAPHTAVAVTSATSQDATVVVVEGTSGNRISLRAVKAGSARVTVETANGADAFTVTTADIAKIELKAPGFIVSDSPQSAGVQGGTARFFVAFRDATNDLIVGQGLPPITVEPSTAATFLATPDVGFLDLKLNEVGSVVLTPTPGEALTFDIVAPEVVTGLELRGLDNTTMLVGGEAPVVLRGTTDLVEKVVGVASLTIFASTTPTTCVVNAAPRAGEGVYQVKTLAAGACAVSATFGELSETRNIEVTAP